MTELTQSQLDELILRSGPLTVAPQSWNDLDEPTRDAFRLLRTVPFTPMRRYYLNLWWLAASQETVDDLNDIAPPNFRIEGRLGLDDVLYIGCDLLTDSVDYGPLNNMEAILTTLPITWYELITWPAPPVDEEE